MISFGFTGESCRTQLYSLWRECFHDEELYTDMFFDELFPMTRCAAAFDGKELCAALYLLPAKLNVCGMFADAAYVYGVGTLPEYRGRGIMRALLNFAAKDCAARRVNYLCLMPASEGLFSLYEKCGYRRCFKFRTVIKAKQEVFVHDNCIKSRNLSENIDKLYNLRFNSICKISGAVLRPREQLEYAVKLLSAEGGGILCCDDGYLLYRKCGGFVEIVEACGVQETTSLLLREAAQRTHANHLRINLHVMSDIFRGEGEVSFGGMLLANDGNYDLGSECPYLGINFD